MLEKEGGAIIYPVNRSNTTDTRAYTPRTDLIPLTPEHIPRQPIVYH